MTGRCSGEEVRVLLEQSAGMIGSSAERIHVWIGDRELGGIVGRQLGSPCVAGGRGRTDQPSGGGRVVDEQATAGGGVVEQLSDDVEPRSSSMLRLDDLRGDQCWQVGTEESADAGPGTRVAPDVADGAIEVVSPKGDDGG